MRISFLLSSTLLVLSAASPCFGLQAEDEPRVTRAFSGYGAYIGTAGMVPSTTFGVKETYLTGERPTYSGPRNFWHAIRYVDSAKTFVQSYVSPTYAVGIQSLSIGDVHPRPGDEIIVVLVTGEIYLYHQYTKEQIAFLDTGVGLVNDFVHYDLNQDGLDELVLLSTSGTHFFSSSGVEFLSRSDLTGNSLVIGQMDGDASLEVATTKGRVMDLQTRQIQCTLPSGFGAHLKLSDVDGDGMDELMYIKNSTALWTYDVDLCSTKWSLTVPNGASYLIADTNHDGSDELLIGESQSGDLYSYDLATQSLLWTLMNPGYSCNGLAFHDFNGDGREEFAWSTGTNTGKNVLWVANGQTHAILWNSEDLIGPFLGPLLADVDGDGVQEIVSAAAKSDHGYGGGRILVLEQDNFVPLLSEETLQGREIEDLLTFDVDGNGDEEIFVVGDSNCEVYDQGLSGDLDLLQSWLEPNDDDIYCLDVLDFDGDGSLEVLLGIGGQQTTVAAYDYASGVEEWRSIQMGSLVWHHVEDIIHGDLDGDGVLEICAFVRGDSCYIWEAGGVLKAVLFGDYQSMRLGPEIPGQGRALLLGDGQGRIIRYRWDGSQIRRDGFLGLLPSSIDGFTPSPHGRVFIGSEGVLRLFQVAGGALLWESESYDEDFGFHSIPLDNGDIVSSGRDAILRFGKE